jgi:predicted acylesterase/phospholipase RssA
MTNANTRVSSHLAPIGRRGLFDLAAGGGLAALLGGCSLPERGPPVPQERTVQATVLGLSNERFLLPHGAAALEQEAAQAIQRLRAAQNLPDDILLSKMQLLAISGGGENGAFGAGLLCGWTEHGTRPIFELVTGVSTGALTAPFAFLGSAYDAKLRTVYTELSTSDILIRRRLTAALFSDALSDNAPLFQTISRHLDERMLADIAQAYDDGRLLLIATTNLDAQVPVIWNIGAIAKSGHPHALDVIRRVLLASAAIPGAFPPAMFDVTADGETYQEMHVDGGAFAQAFLYPTAVTRMRRERRRGGEPVTPATAYVIRNGRLDPEWARVERRAVGIAGRAISTMIAASGHNDVIRMYNTTKRDGINFRLAYISNDFSADMPAPFDNGFMRALFEYGYERGRAGYDWATQPPIA